MCLMSLSPRRASPAWRPVEQLPAVPHNQLLQLALPCAAMMVPTSTLHFTRRI